MSSNQKQVFEVEFALKLKEPDDFIEVSRSLVKKGITSFVRNDNDGTVVVQLDTENHDSINSIQEFIEKETNIPTSVVGLGQSFSAISELHPCPSHGKEKVLGVVRLSTLPNESCLFDGSLYGFSPLVSSKRRYCVGVHEYGSLVSDDYSSIGNQIIKIDEHELNESQEGYAFRCVKKNCDVKSLIGKSIAIMEAIDSKERKETDPNIVSAGIIARASTVGTNKKKICTCSGRTLWEERDLKGQNS